MTLGELRGPSQQQSRISGPIRRVTTPRGGSTQRLDGDRSLPALACPKPDTQVLARCPLRVLVVQKRAGGSLDASALGQIDNKIELGGLFDWKVGPASPFPDTQVSHGRNCRQHMRHASTARATPEPR
jgi:hypothetical protein